MGMRYLLLSCLFLMGCTICECKRISCLNNNMTIHEDNSITCTVDIDELIYGRIVK